LKVLTEHSIDVLLDIQEMLSGGCFMIRNKIIALLVLGILSYAFPLHARKSLVFSYKGLTEKSDLVVIATAIQKTSDTKEKSNLPNIFIQKNDGKKEAVSAIGVETVFRVSVVLKGDKTLKQFTLHHYREAESENHLAAEGPHLVSFNLADRSEIYSSLLFLVKESDGRYAPTGGQTDPGYNSIIRIPVDSDLELLDQLNKPKR
jgi:hypothetical protein